MFSNVKDEREKSKKFSFHGSCQFVLKTSIFPTRRRQTNVNEPATFSALSHCCKNDSTPKSHMQMKTIISALGFANTRFLILRHAFISFPFGRNLKFSLFFPSSRVESLVSRSLLQNQIIGTKLSAFARYRN